MPQWKQYSGIWTSTQQAQAVAAETWTGLVFNEFYTWGSNGNGQLGENAVGSLSRSSPTQVGGKDNWDKIVGSGRSSTFFAVKDNGTLWSWGLNSFGVQGHGDTISRSSPVQVGALTNWSEASMDTNHSLAIKTDGTLWVIGGDNDKGQHGLNDRVQRSSPVQIGAGTDWYKFDAGNEFSLATKTDGTLWSWGDNDALTGKLGQNNLILRSSPTQIGSLTNWDSVSASERVGLAVKTDGTLWTWGNQNFGRLGNNVAINSGQSSPIQVGALTTWAVPEVASEGSYAIKTDGTLWAWGSGASGRIGNGSTINMSSPVQITAATTWSKIASGPSTAIALKTDGTLWSWGAGTYGQLGNGLAVNKSSPVQIGSDTGWQNVGCTTTAAAATQQRTT
jgi:alpha-tubulin suppressor-like RCC1 family protein